MKKALVLFLAVAMVFSFATSAMAFSDLTDEKTATQDAINLFAAQGILTGYPDGTFLPDGTITRAEMAAVVIRYTNNVILAESLKNVPSEFTDVKTGEWYTGYVNAAVALGYFQGMGDGTFGVSKNLTYGQVVTIALRLAGYNDELPGAWPYDYVAQASKGANSLVKAATTFDTAADATRKDVILIFNALLGYDMVTYDKETNKFNTATVPVKVRAEFGAMPEGASKTVAVTYDAKKGFLVDGTEIAEGFAVSNGYDLVDLINGSYTGTIYKNADGKVCYVDLKGAYAQGLVTAYTAATSTKAGSVTVNGVAYEVPYTGVTATGASLAKGVYAELTLTAGKVSAVKGTNAVDNSYAIVGKLAADGKTFATEAVADSATGTLTVVADKKVFVVIKDGALATVADIESGDLVKALSPITGVDYLYEVISPVGEVAITAMTGAAGATIDSYVINGVTYTGNLQLKKGEANFAAMTLGDYTAAKNSIKNKTGVFYTDAKGFALAMVYDKVEEVKTTDVYGYIMDGTLVTGTKAESLGAVGTTVALGYSDLTLYTTAGESVKYAVKDNGYTDNNKADDIFTVSGTTVKLGATTIAKGLFVKATLNEEGVITALAIESVTPVTVKTDKDYNTISFGSPAALYNLPADTPVFNVTTKDSKFDKVAVAKASSVIADLNNKSAYVKVIKGAVAFIVIEDLTAAPVVNTNYVVLETLYAEGNKIKFVGNDTLFANDITGFGTTGYTAPEVGDIVTYAEGTKGITAITVKASPVGETAVKIKAVNGSVLTYEGDTSVVIGSKAAVFVYEATKSGDNATITKYAGAGTTADLVKGAYAYGVDLDGKTGLDLFIVVK